MSVTIVQLRELRASLPKGQKDPWGECCRSKRVLLNRALRKNALTELTVGEQGVINEFVLYCNQLRKAQTKVATQINNLYKIEL